MNGRIKRYTNKWYATVTKAQAEANRTGKVQNVIETVDGVFFGTVDQFPQSGVGYYSTLVRPVR